MTWLGQRPEHKATTFFASYGRQSEGPVQDIPGTILGQSDIPGTPTRNHSNPVFHPGYAGSTHLLLETSTDCGKKAETQRGETRGIR